MQQTIAFGCGPLGGHYTMDPEAAAIAAELLGVTHVLPIHWGTCPALAGTPDELEAAIRARAGKVIVHHWQPDDSVG